jgi:uncharacterized protein YegL
VTENGTHKTTPDGDRLHVSFVLDESGSMGRLAPAVVEGFDEFVSELREGGENTYVSLTLFDTELSLAYLGFPLADVQPLARMPGYRPRGGTALFDAIAHTVLATDERLSVSGAQDDKVLVVVMTDGYENASREYDAKSLAALVARYQARPNWTFVYLGAAHGSVDDARDFAELLAFERTNAMRWRADGVSARKTIKSLALAVKYQRSSTQRKSGRVFEDAGQTEADYVEDEGRATPRGARGRGARPTDEQGALFTDTR